LQWLSQELLALSFLTVAAGYSTGDCGAARRSRLLAKQCSVRA